MESVCLGQELGGYDGFDNIKPTEEHKFFIYDYRTGSYEGWGVGVTVWSDGRLSYTTFSHCSCYGPVEAGDWPGKFVSREEWDLLVAKESKGYDPESVISEYEEPWVRVNEKLKELLG